MSSIESLKENNRRLANELRNLLIQETNGRVEDNDFILGSSMELNGNLSSVEFASLIYTFPEELISELSLAKSKFTAVEAKDFYENKHVYKYMIIAPVAHNYIFTLYWSYVGERTVQDPKMGIFTSIEDFIEYVIYL